jgi:hypothetical protein
VIPTREPGDPGPAHQRRTRIIVVAGVALLAAIAAGTALYRHGDDHPTRGLTVEWGGSEGHPCCVYNPQDHTVEAEITIEGTAHTDREMTVTVTAYADENTSQPVGSGSRTVQVDGTVHKSLIVTIPVDKTPHVDEDGVTACSFSVE